MPKRVIVNGNGADWLRKQTRAFRGILTSVPAGELLTASGEREFYQNVELVFDVLAKDGFVIFVQRDQPMADDQMFDSCGFLSLSALRHDIPLVWRKAVISKESRLAGYLTCFGRLSYKPAWTPEIFETFAAAVAHGCKFLKSNQIKNILDPFSSSDLLLKIANESGLDAFGVRGI